MALRAAPALLLAGCQQGPAQPPAAQTSADLPARAIAVDLADTGHALASARCGRCHATEPHGSSPLPQAPVFRSLSHRYPLDTLAEALAEGIVAGHAAMPSDPWKPEEIDALLAYLRSMQQP